MELIELVNLEGSTIVFKYFGTSETKKITNVGFPVAGHFDFTNPKSKIVNNTYVRICDGNIIDEVDDEVAIYILQSTGEGVHYIIKVDAFNELFEEIE